MLFKTNYRRVYAQTVHGIRRKLRVGQKRGAVSIIVAEAHALTTRASESTILDQFVSFGYVRTQPTSLMKMFPMPTDYKYTKEDEVIKQFREEALEAARPAPAPTEPLAEQKQLSISSFFAAHNTQH